METIGANILIETVYPGVNVGCIVTGNGAICVDTPLLPGEAQRWRARIRSLGAEEVRFVVYTSGQQERILGTQYFIYEEEPEPAPEPEPEPPRGRSRGILFPWTTPSEPPDLSKAMPTGSVVSHRAAWDRIKEHTEDNFKQSMVDSFGDRDPDMVNLRVIPPQITFDEQIRIYAGTVRATLLAPAKGIAWVWIPLQRVLFTGEAVVVGTHPSLEVVDVREWLQALERLREDSQFQGAVIVPGRGSVCDVTATEPLTEYLRLALERTQEVFQTGQTKADLNAVAAEMVPLFPVADGQKERVQRQIKMGLDHIYDQLKAADAESA